MKQQLTELMKMRKALDDLEKTVLDLFNKNTPSHFDGDPLFQPTSSPICKWWKPREEDEDEELFMNYNCGHPDADDDWGEGDHCAIAGCPDEEKATQMAGKLAQVHSEIHPIMMKVLDLFNNKKNYCESKDGKGCKEGAEYCAAACCPLAED
jgi:hypothetical protein